MNSLPQAAQACAISWDAAGRAASTAGSSTVGDRQNSCCVSLITSAIARTLSATKQASSQSALIANVFARQLLAISLGYKVQDAGAIITRRAE
jgi:hypothetical protein